MAGGPKRAELHIPKAEEDDGVELSLGLSVGGSSQKPEGVTEAPKGFNAGMIAERSGALPLFPTDDPDLLDPERKREYHALRRKEARRKQDAKLQRRGILRGRSRVIQAYAPRPARASSSEDRAALKAPEPKARVRDQQARENEPSGGGGPVRRSSGQKGRQYSERNTNPASVLPNPSPICSTNPSQVFSHTPNTILNPTPISTANPSPIPDQTPPPMSFGVPPVPVPVPLMPMQIPYQPLPFVPYGNGYAITCMVPCWAPAIPTIQPLSPPPAASNGLDQIERSLFQPVPQRAVRQLVPPAHPGSNSGGPGYDEEMNAGKVVMVTRIPSWRSDSLHGSEHRSNSIHGESSGSSSSDARTNSSSTVSEKRRLCIAPLGIPRGRRSDHSMSPHNAASSSTTNKVVRSAGQTSTMSKLNVALPYRVKLEGAAAVYLNLEDPSDESGMPFVATTGDGPDGKTITGFLYSYSKGEVSIMCVCHGSTFTPAEFVRHAGGTDMEHPLKHIVIVPSA